MTQAQFRIGGIYRNKYGEMVRLIASSEDSAHPALSVRLAANANVNGEALHRLCDGRNDEHESYPRFDLIPGEVNEKGEPIAPTFYISEPLKPATLGDLLRSAQDKLEAGCASQTVQRQEVNLPDGWSRIGYDLAAGNFVISTNKPVTEPKRPRLTWADSKAFDAFPDFAVSTDTNEPDHAYSHPTTRIADAGAQTNPKHGSAWLAG